MTRKHSLSSRLLNLSVGVAYDPVSISLVDILRSQRHVKCDEAHPICSKCRKANFTCRYEAPKNLMGDPSYPFSPTVAGSPVELRAFDFFCRRTSVAIQGHLDSRFWTSHVLQMSHSEPCVLHAAIALGSLHENFGNHDKTLPSDAQSLIEGDFAIEQYRKAVRHLGHSISTRRDEAVPLSLTCAVLFISFDNLNGDTFKATTHLRSALRILNEQQDQRRTTSHDIASIADMLGRYDVQAASYGDMPNFDVVVKPLEDFPGSFKNLTEGARFLIPTLNWVLHLDRSHDYFLAFRTNDSIQKDVRATAFTLSAILSARLSLWDTIYNNLLVRSLPTMSSTELKASTLLKIYHACATILAAVCQNSDETAYDLCLKHFDNILKLCESLLAAQQADNSADRTPFSCEMGVICALSFASRKCRHPITRRKAIALFKKAPLREGQWDRKNTPLSANTGRH